MKHLLITVLALSVIWGCSGDGGRTDAPPQTPLARQLTGAWVRPEPGTMAGMILLPDGSCRRWTYDALVYPGTWSIKGEGSDSPELHLDLGGSGEEVYEIARYNNLSLQLRGDGPLSVILRRGKLGTLEVTVDVEGRLPRGAVLHASLNRFGFLLDNVRIQEREPVEVYTAPIRGLPVKISFYYIDNFTAYSLHELEARVEDAAGNTIFTLEEALPVNLGQPKPIRVRLK